MSKKIGNRRSIVGLPSQSYTAKHAIIFISSLLLLLSPAGAQSGPDGTGPNPYAYQKFTPTMIIVVVVLVVALFLMAFFSVYVRQRSETSTTGATLGRSLGGISASLRRRAAARGLDPAVIETFPTFEYSAVKGLNIGKGDALECAVCLNEFEDEDTLRLIPKCDHVFHPECIDTWLSSHVTCPVCRANLVPQPGQTNELPELEENQIPENDDVSIRVLEDQEEVESVISVPPQVVDRNRPQRSWSMKPRFLGKFGRSYTTGHLVVQPGENTDRFTLRLPVDVRKQVMSRALNRTASCAVILLPTEASSRIGYRTGVGAKSNKRLDRKVKSDRWVFSRAPPFLTRSSSLRSPNVIAADGEGSMTSSSKRMKTAVKLPSFHCLEPKGDEEAVLVSADSARHPV